MIHGKNMQVTLGDSSKLQGDLNFTFDQRESKVNLHKANSSAESPSNVSPACIYMKPESGESLVRICHIGRKFEQVRH
jgi:hypothetical protein